MVDKVFCMNSYLMFRYIYDSSKQFYSDMPVNIVDISFERTPVKTSDDLIKVLREKMEKYTADGKAALALSGGIDSAILARFMPKGSKAYTFRCIVPGKEVTDESGQARRWAELCGLDQEVIDVYWEEVVESAVKLMLHKGAPIHSIETQIYLAAKRALEEGYTKFIFGENADIIYGGMNGLLAKDWTYGEFVERYSYVMPYKVLRQARLILDPYLEYEKNGHIDGHDFINKYFRQEALGTYNNACETAGISFLGPYSETCMGVTMDYERIRSGETKYLIREAFHKLYPGEKLPTKIPMPRPTNEWLANWKGPVRNEFIPDAVGGMTGDQKWMVWSLEKFLDINEGER